MSDAGDHDRQKDVRDADRPEGEGSAQDNDSLDRYIGMEDTWPEQRLSRRRARRGYRKQQPRQIRVRGERLDPPDPVRLSRALIAAQRELLAAQAETEARAAAASTSTDGPDHTQTESSGTTPSSGQHGGGHG